MRIGSRNEVLAGFEDQSVLPWLRKFKLRSCFCLRVVCARRSRLFGRRIIHWQGPAQGGARNFFSRRVPTESLSSLVG